MESKAVNEDLYKAYCCQSQLVNDSIYPLDKANQSFTTAIPDNIWRASLRLLWTSSNGSLFALIPIAANSPRSNTFDSEYLKKLGLKHFWRDLVIRRC